MTYFHVIASAGHDRPVFDDGAVVQDVYSGLAAVVEVLDEGVDVEGYYVWSLMDNYEWNHGMSMTFGLYEVDTASKERTLRTVGADYADIVGTHRLPG